METFPDPNTIVLINKKRLKLSNVEKALRQEFETDLNRHLKYICDLEKKVSFHNFLFVVALILFIALSVSIVSMVIK